MTEMLDRLLVLSYHPLFISNYSWEKHVYNHMPHANKNQNFSLLIIPRALLVHEVEYYPNSLFSFIYI